MAKEDVVSKVEEVLRRAWIKKSLELQRAALFRSRGKEIPGSEIYALRTKELQLLDQLILEEG